MSDVVRDYFPTFSETFEGSVPWMYLDILGLVTTAIGNLIDPYPPNYAGITAAPSSALALPWVWKTDGRAATTDEIAAEWAAVKAHPKAAKQGHRVLEELTNLRLTKEGIRALVLAKFDLNQKILIERFPDFMSWPAEARLATHSMAWACGPAFRFSSLARALTSKSFRDAANECHIDDTHNPGVTPRNKANVWLYNRAQQAQDLNEDFSLLEYPEGSTHGDTNEPVEIDGGTVHPRVDLNAMWEEVKKDLDE